MIEVKNLYKSYGDVKAVQDISFSVKPREVYAFLGENGAGKSTTINILCTILRKDKGEVLINGHKLDYEDDKIKKDIGVVFQGSYLDDNMTVNENLEVRAALYGYSKKEIKERINNVNKLLKMDEFLNRKYNKLSGGQRRRADIARAILHTPKLLILDEPTTGLDPATRSMVWNIIKELQKKFQMTIFFSTHYMEETEIANRISIIKEGKIAVTDTPYKLKQKYSYDTLNLYGDKTKITHFLSNKKLKYKVNNDFISVKVDNSKTALKIINKINEIIDSFEVRKGNMDTVFLTVTGKDYFGSEGNEDE